MPTSPDQLTLWPVDLPVSPTVSRVSVLAKRTRGTSGQKWLASSESSDRLSSSLRMYLASALQPLTKSSLTWNRKATPAGRSWWVPSMSARPTEGTVFGSSGSWHTPNLAAQAQNWPTPTAQPYGSNQGGAQGRVGSIRPSLEPLAREIEWATPSARDWRSGLASAETMDRNSRPLNEQVCSGRPAHASDSTNGKPRGSLNSAWVAQLMGLPSDWCDLPTEVLSELWATRSSGTRHT